MYFFLYLYSFRSKDDDDFPDTITAQLTGNDDVFYCLGILFLDYKRKKMRDHFPRSMVFFFFFLKKTRIYCTTNYLLNFNYKPFQCEYINILDRHRGDEGLFLVRFSFYKKK